MSDSDMIKLLEVGTWKSKGTLWWILTSSPLREQERHFSTVACNYHSGLSADSTTKSHQFCLWKTIGVLIGLGQNHSRQYISRRRNGAFAARGNATLFDAVGDVADSVNLEAGSFAKGCFFGYLMGLFDSNGGTPNWMVFLLFPFNVPHSSPDSLNLIGDPGPIYSCLLDSFRQNTT